MNILQKLTLSLQKGSKTHIKLPARVADLATGLTDVDGDAFSLKMDDNKK